MKQDLLREKPPNSPHNMWRPPVLRTVGRRFLCPILAIAVLLASQTVTDAQQFGVSGSAQYEYHPTDSSYQQPDYRYQAPDNSYQQPSDYNYRRSEPIPRPDVRQNGPQPQSLDFLADSIVRQLESDPMTADLLYMPQQADVTERYGSPQRSYIPGVGYVLNDDATYSDGRIYDQSHADYESSRPSGSGQRLRDPTTSLFQDRMVIDFGYSYSRDSFDGYTLEQHYVPDLLVRYSLTDRLELRIGWTGWISERLTDDIYGTSASDSRRANPSFGVKYRLCHQQGWRPQLLGVVSAPIAMDGNPLATENFQPMTSVIYGWTVSDRWSIYGSSGLAYQRLDDSNYFDLQQTMTVDRMINDRWGSYGQWTYLLPDGGDRKSEHAVYGGLYWMYADWLQFDTRIGVGVNSPATDLIVGFGCTVAY